ncbi:hypothetical protein EDD86DRAFT_196404 [Gorgonomyces haynaldii]|nr:hypothetical protein EDD86DRAFT_196404 [Gorgonomyces haynaldii]
MTETQGQPRQERIVVETEPQRKPKLPSKFALRMIAAASGVDPKRKPNPIFPDNGLSIVERYFVHTPKSQPQVIMMVGGKMQFPRSAQRYSYNRLVEILKIATAKHFRLCGTIDSKTHTVNLVGKTAADLKLNVDFTPYTGDYKIAAMNALNYQYDLEDSTMPFWRTDIIGPREMDGNGFNRPAEWKEDAPTPEFYVFFSFHHSLGDGLATLAFAKTFMQICTAELLNKSYIDLKEVPLETKPPVLLDNLIRANVADIIFPATTLIKNQILYNGRLARFKRIFEPDQTRPSRIVSVHPEPQPESPRSDAGSPDMGEIVNRNPALQDRTNIQVIMIGPEEYKKIRDQCKANKTTLSCAMVVTALAAIKLTFQDRAKQKKLRMPNHQGWIVTSSMRHLIPESKLLMGGDKETDPGINLFGGYGASISDPKFKILESNKFWSRCRSVKQKIAKGAFPSMRRMKMMNWTFRHPKIWQFLQKKLDLNKVTRTYSIELANLGAWDAPWATSEDPWDDDRLRSSWFSGSINNSFVGARALMTMAVVTLDNDYSITVSYNTSSVSDQEAQTFMQHFRKGMAKIAESSPKLKVDELFQ